MYLKIDSSDGVLLSECICRQTAGHSSSTIEKYGQWVGSARAMSHIYIIMTVNLVKGVNLLTHQSVLAQVQCHQKSASCLIEETQKLQQDTGVQCEATWSRVMTLA